MPAVPSARAGAARATGSPPPPPFVCVDLCAFNWPDIGLLGPDSKLDAGDTLGQGRCSARLAHFHKRCADILVTCLESFLQVCAPGPSNIWLVSPVIPPVGPCHGLTEVYAPSRGTTRRQVHTFLFLMHHHHAWVYGRLMAVCGRFCMAKSKYGIRPVLCRSSTVRLRDP